MTFEEGEMRAELALAAMRRRDEMMERACAHALRAQLERLESQARALCAQGYQLSDLHRVRWPDGSEEVRPMTATDRAYEGLPRGGASTGETMARVPAGDPQTWPGSGEQCRKPCPADLQRLAATDPLLRAHLQRWEMGAVTWEEMLLGLVLHLAEQVSRLQSDLRTVLAKSTPGPIYRVTPVAQSPVAAEPDADRPTCIIAADGDPVQLPPA